MKTPNRVTVLALPALILGQGIAGAASKDSAAVAACTGAIADYFEGRQGIAPMVQIDSSAMGQDHRLDKINVFELDALDPATRNVVGRFTCTVNERAIVRRLVTLPLTAPDAMQRRQG